MVKKLRKQKASTECDFEVRENYHYSVCKTRDGQTSLTYGKKNSKPRHSYVCDTYVTFRC